MGLKTNVCRLRIFWRKSNFDVKSSLDNDCGLQRMLRPTVDGLVAQSVEQRIENPCVGGSIPPRATKIKRPNVLSWAFPFVHST